VSVIKVGRAMPPPPIPTPLLVYHNQGGEEEERTQPACSHKERGGVLFTKMGVAYIIISCVLRNSKGGST
jgi:hypothetical protein